MILDAVKDFGQKLQLIGLIPTALAASLLALFVIGDAPSRPLNLTTVTDVLARVGVAGGFLLLFVSAAISITLQPLQFRLVQLFEGYWSSRLLSWPFRLGVWRQTRRFDRLAKMTSSVTVDDILGQRLAHERREDAKAALITRLPRRDHLLPTELGNVLRAMEERAGARYGIESIAIWRRLYPVLPRDHAEALENEVIQLDVSVRLAATWFITGIVALGLLLRDPAQTWEHKLWLLLVGLVFVAAWLSYRSAIESALAHASDVEVTLDLYRDFLLDAARMPSAATLADEAAHFAALTAIYQARNADHGINYTLVARRLTGPKSH